MNTDARQKGVLQLMEKYSNAILVAWFPQTQEQWQNYLQLKGISDTVMIAQQINALQLVGKTVIILEHYPLVGKESAFLENLRTNTIYITSALDEPLFTYFGGERITDLPEAMGMGQDETIEHELVTRAIRNAQRKLGKQVSVEHTARNSMQKWFEKNGRK